MLSLIFATLRRDCKRISAEMNKLPGDRISEFLQGLLVARHDILAGI